nr:MAG: peptide ABC transporter permease [Thermoproteus sp. AZ2]
MALYLFLALHADKVFGVLVYSEQQLMPNDVEPEIVDRILGQHNSTGVTPIVVYGPNLAEKLKELNATLSAEGYDAISPLTIEQIALNIYWENINNTINNYTQYFSNNLNKLYIILNNECIGLNELVSAYKAALNNATTLLYATYGAALFNVSTPQTAEFLAYYRRYVGEYGVDEAVRLAADEAYGNVSWLLANITWRNWASQEAAELVARRILSLKLNATLISLAANVSQIGVEKYLYYKAVEEAPPPLRPYIPYVLCANRTQEAVAAFRQQLLADIMKSHPPPTMYSIPQAAQMLYGDEYAVVLVQGTATQLNYSWAVPVSSDILLSQFTHIVTSEVPEIDKTTALVLFAVLLFVFGTLAAPIAILAEIGLSYLALLGLLYLISPYIPPYYLAVYVAAPIVFALGVDYNLLMLGRYAEERNKGADKEEAIARSMAFAKRAVLASGLVAASALGSFALSRLLFMQTIGISFILSVALVLFTTFVATPSLLSIFGDKLFWPRKIEEIRLHEGRAGLLSRLVDIALSRSKLIIVIFTIITIFLSIFILKNIKITTNYVNAMPEIPAKQAMGVLLTYFRNISALSVTYLAVPYKPPQALLEDLTKLPYYVNYTVSYKNNYYIITLKTSLSDTSDKLLQVYNDLAQLRDKYGFFYIGGAAGWKNVYYNYIFVYFWSTQIYIIIFFVIFILSIVLRSIFTPLRLVATVLMSFVFGLALDIAVFQIALGQLTYWLQPVILSSLLIAVGTDYDVFIVSRIREEVERGLDEKAAIRTAIMTTGPIVTGAALILALAFLSIVESQLTVLQQVGLTVAFAAMFDAYVVRPLLVPAIMNMLSKYNWWWPFRRG